MRGRLQGQRRKQEVTFGVGVEWQRNNGPMLRGDETGSGLHCHILCPSLGLVAQHWAAPACSSQIASLDFGSPIVGPGALFGEREDISPSPEEKVTRRMDAGAPIECSGCHFGTATPLVTRQFRIGL